MALPARQKIMSDYVTSVLHYARGVCKQMRSSFLNASEEFGLVKKYIECGDNKLVNVFNSYCTVFVIGKYIFILFKKLSAYSDDNEWLCDISMYERKIGTPIDKFMFGTELEINLVDIPSERTEYNATVVTNRSYNFVHTSDVHDCFEDCAIKVIKKRNGYTCQKIYDRRFPLSKFGNNITGLNCTYDINHCAE